MNLQDDDSIVDQAGNPLGGVGLANGNFTGEVYNVRSISQAPTLDPISNIGLLVSAGLQTVNLTGITDNNGGIETITISAVSDNTALVPNPTVTYTNPNSTGTLTFTPTAGLSGTAQITVTAQDALGSSTQKFTVTVVAPPAITVDPLLDGFKHTNLALTGISLSDPFVGSSNIRVTLSAVHGVVSVNTGVSGGVSAGSVSGNGSSVVTLTDTLSADQCHAGCQRWFNVPG